MVALLATGGSTNHTMHLVAMAAAAGIDLTWQDFAELSSVVPLLARIYPNGSADINQFQAAGGTASLFQSAARCRAAARGRADRRRPRPQPLLPTRPSSRTTSSSGSDGAGTPARVDPAVLRAPAEPFATDGGIRVLDGSSAAASSRSRPSPMRAASSRLRRACSTTSRTSSMRLSATSSIRDVVVVVRFQGPEGQRHAGAAQADAGARRAAGPRPPGRAGHRRPHVRRVGQGPGRDPLHARGRRRRSALTPAGRRRDPHRHARRRHST